MRPTVGIQMWLFGMVIGAFSAVVWLQGAWYFALPLVILSFWGIPLEQPREERQPRADDRHSTSEHVR